MFVEVDFQLTHYHRAFRHSEVLVPFGGDFRFRDAEAQFSNMDKIINFINSNPTRYSNASIRYTTFSEYFARLKNLKVAFPVLSAVPGESTMESPSSSPASSPFMPHCQFKHL